MSPLLMTALVALMLATSFLSGIFGMAGGLILIGVLLTLLPVPEAMALHAITQMASNGWRGLLWLKFVRWKPVVMYLAGAVAAFAVWAFWQYVPSSPIALLMLGISPFIARVVPENF